MDLGEVDIAHVIGAVVVADLPTCPIHAFDLDDFIVLNGADGGDCVLLVHCWARRRGGFTVGVPTVLEDVSILAQRVELNVTEEEGLIHEAHSARLLAF